MKYHTDYSHNPLTKISMADILQFKNYKDYSHTPLTKTSMTDNNILSCNFFDKEQGSHVHV